MKNLSYFLSYFYRIYEVSSKITYQKVLKIIYFDINKTSGLDTSDVAVR